MTAFWPVRAATPSAAAEIAVPETAELLTRFKNLTDRMAFLCERRIKRERERVNALSARRIFTDPEGLYREQRMRLDSLFQSLEYVAERKLSDSRAMLSTAAAKLDALSPLAILSRGYTVVTKDGKTIKHAKDIPTEGLFSVRFADGAIIAKKIGDLSDDDK